MAHCVLYDGEFLCAFHDISEPLKQTIFTILNCNYESLDLSKLILISYRISVEIERIGETILALAQELRAKIHASCNQSSEEQQAHNLWKHEESRTDSMQNIAEDDVTSRKPQLNVEFGIDGKYTKLVNESLLQDIEAKLAEEKQRNSRLESKLEELRVIQEDSLTRMEKRVKQGQER